MPDMNGMDVAKKMRDKGWQKILIFVTGEEDKVFNAFDLHAFHFQLLYAEVFNRKIIFHMDKENIEYYGRLSALEELVGKDFYHIHRSYITALCLASLISERENIPQKIFLSLSIYMFLWISHSF